MQAQHESCSGGRLGLMVPPAAAAARVRSGGLRSTEQRQTHKTAGAAHRSSAPSFLRSRAAFSSSIARFLSASTLRSKPWQRHIETDCETCLIQLRNRVARVRLHPARCGKIHVSQQGCGCAAAT